MARRGSAKGGAREAGQDKDPVVLRMAGGEAEMQSAANMNHTFENNGMEEPGQNSPEYIVGRGGSIEERHKV